MERGLDGLPITAEGRRSQGEKPAQRARKAAARAAGARKAGATSARAVASRAARRGVEAGLLGHPTKPRIEARKEGKGATALLTSAQRKKLASRRDKAGPAEFSGGKRHPEVPSTRPRASKKSHPARPGTP